MKIKRKQLTGSIVENVVGKTCHISCSLTVAQAGSLHDGFIVTMLLL